MSEYLFTFKALKPPVFDEWFKYKEIYVGNSAKEVWDGILKSSEGLVHNEYLPKLIDVKKISCNCELP